MEKTENDPNGALTVRRIPEGKKEIRNLVG